MRKLSNEQKQNFQSEILQLKMELLTIEGMATGGSFGHSANRNSEKILIENKIRRLERELNGGSPAIMYGGGRKLNRFFSAVLLLGLIIAALLVFVNGFI